MASVNGSEHERVYFFFTPLHTRRQWKWFRQFHLSFVSVFFFYLIQLSATDLTTSTRHRRRCPAIRRRHHRLTGSIPTRVASTSSIIIITSSSNSSRRSTLTERCTGAPEFRNPFICIRWLTLTRTYRLRWLSHPRHLPDHRYPTHLFTLSTLRPLRDLLRVWRPFWPPAVAETATAFPRRSFKRRWRPVPLQAAAVLAAAKTITSPSWLCTIWADIRPIPAWPVRRDGKRCANRAARDLKDAVDPARGRTEKVRHYSTLGANSST